MKDKKLDEYLNAYTQFNDWLIHRRYKEFTKYFNGKSCLEMGTAEGTGIDYLLDHFDKVTVIDGSKEAIQSVAKRFNTERLNAVHSYFEDMDLGDEHFDTIVLAHILEHVDTPQITLEKAKKYLSKDGIMIIDVPNGNSLHRQIGVKMGLLTEKTQLNDADLSIGHQRVYTPETFKKEIEDAGLEIIIFGGMFVKVLSNAQTEKVFDANQLEALFTVGGDNPDISAEIFIVARAR